MLRDWTRDPLKENLLHVDLIRIGAKTRLKVKVPIHTKGDPKGVKLEGGIFSFILREVEVECLPEDIPEEIQVDIRELMVGDGVRVGDLLLGEKVKLETDPRRIVLHVVAPRVEEEKLAEEEVAADATAEEPELIRKQKAAEEGEGEGIVKEAARRRRPEAVPAPPERKRNSDISLEADRRPRQSRPRIRFDAPQFGLPGGRVFGPNRGARRLRAARGGR